MLPLGMKNNHRQGAKLAPRSEIDPLLAHFHLSKAGHWGEHCSLGVTFQPQGPKCHPRSEVVVKIQSCQMVSFQTKNPNLGKFWGALDGKMLINFSAIWNILPTFGIFMTIWYFLCSLGTFFPGLVSCN
jgi:hypothetical protein